MPRLLMTPDWLNKIKHESAGEWIDTRERGLRLRIRRGRAVWSVRYVADDGRHVRLKLGEYPAVGLSAARKLALGAKGQQAGGNDPAADKREAREQARLRKLGDTVDGAVTSWLADRKLGPRARWKGGIEGGTARAFLPHVRRLQRDLGSKRLADLTARDLERFVSAPETPATRNRALTALRLFYWWAKRKGLVDADPTAAAGKEREAPRTRTLTDAELRALVLGFEPTRYGRAVRLLALTGLRRDEVLGACWSWLDAEAGVLTIPGESEKTGRSRGQPRRVALSPQAVALLAAQRAALFAEGTRSEFIFATTTGERPHADSLKPTLYGLRGMRSNGQPASTHKRAKLRAVLLAADATIHDVRRTVADALLNRLGVAPWVVDHVVLGHARPRLLRTYMPTLPLDEARAALTRWAELLEQILSVTPEQKGGRA